LTNIKKESGQKESGESNKVAKRTQSVMQDLAIHKWLSNPQGTLHD